MWRYAAGHRVRELACGSRFLANGTHQLYHGFYPYTYQGLLPTGGCVCKTGESDSRSSPRSHNLKVECLLLMILGVSSMKEDANMGQSANERPSRLPTATLSSSTEKLLKLLQPSDMTNYPGRRMPSKPARLRHFQQETPSIAVEYDSHTYTNASSFGTSFVARRFYAVHRRYSSHE